MIKNYYEIFDLSPKDSRWKILKVLQQIIREKIDRNHDLTDAVVAFRVLVDIEAKRIYDLNLEKPDPNYRSLPRLVAFIAKWETLANDPEIYQYFDKKAFWKKARIWVFWRSLGMQFIITSGFDRSGILLFFIHTCVFYLVPVVISTDFPPFVVVVILIWLGKLYVSYKEEKFEHYERLFNTFL
ncbi:MAG: hypothetical protein JJU02_05685 [Cryomorphaceae bacterium]|nr:hypothetical protein [Cryomorphaceae bacterium]